MEKIKMSDVAEQIRGVSYKPEDVVDGSREGAIGILRANNISDGVINFNDLVFVKRDRVLQKQILRKGDILICASSGSKHLVGKAAQIEADCEYSFGAFCKVVRPQKIDAMFLGMYFQSDLYRKYISGVSQGANINNIKNEHIDVIEIRGYSNDEQVKIAELLQIVIGTIRLQKEQIKRYDVLVKARFVEMFGDPISNPFRWDKILLNECLESIDNGKSFVCDSVARVGENPAILKLSAVTYGVYKPEENKSILDEKDFVESAEVYEGDLLFTRKNTPELVGMAAYVVSTPPKLMMPDLIFRLNTKKSCNKIFLWQLINHDLFRGQIQNIASGSAKSMSNISKERLGNLSIYLPPIELQEQFAAFVHQVDKSKFAVQKALDKTQLLFDSLMQKYFG